MSRLTGFVLALLLAAAPQALRGQYFGQNKVMYSSFDFKIIETEHFDVYFYDRAREAAMDVARMAERSYARLSRILNHRFRERKPIILYASQSDFQQTNTTPGEISEGTGGFTDFFKHRNVIPLTGSYADVDHVLMHEMVHQFQYDIWSGGIAGGGLQTMLEVNPPLWFVEGMAEYLSLGEIDPPTAMWLRDAAAEGKIPSIRELETDPRIFPYRFGQAIVTYIGQRWGDEAIGAILKTSRTGSLETGFRRIIGLDFRQFSEQWKDAIQKQYLPELQTRVKARAVADEVLSEGRSDGTLHLAPALSPDGSLIAYFSEKDFYFVDLWLADVTTGRARHRLFESSWSSNYETFRFINSSASWSPDGQLIAFAAKRGATDDILILDAVRNKEVQRLRVDLSGITTPSWSPDGTKLVFTGQERGVSDLYIIDRETGSLRQLTNDRYADLQPVWSPDGQTIAFTTDRGPDTDFDILKIGNYRVALYHLDDGRIDILPGMDHGKNMNPQWAPDGRALAYVSDRTGVSNLYLYEFSDQASYRLTDFYTGIQGISALSPAISWARGADKLAFVYYERGKYDVYTINNPRQRKQAPWQVSELVAAAPQVAPEPRPSAPPTAVSGSSAIYLTQGGNVRRADSVGVATDPNPSRQYLGIRALLDSMTLGLPDTASFAERPYSAKYAPDYIARPSIGYARDNFGRGFFGGTTISLSDMLGDRQILFSGAINGRIDEAQVIAAYSNVKSRLNWAAGISQDPYFFYQGSGVLEAPGMQDAVYVEQVRRLVLRSAFSQASYPFSRFARLEGRVSLVNVDDAIMSYNTPFDPFSGYQTGDLYTSRDRLSSTNYVQPAVALVYDNALGGYVGAMLGRRSRFEIAPTVGGWNFTQVTADYRRYDRLLGPFTIATRLIYEGRMGRDADRFTMFLGYPDLLRGYTSGSFSRNECRNVIAEPGTLTGCSALDQLVGTSFAVANAELRFPLLNASLGFIPIGFPPIEGALFYDAGVAWDKGSTVKWSRPEGASLSDIRKPLQSMGFSIRVNALGLAILRFDYTKPLERPGTKPFWTISLGEVF